MSMMGPPFMAPYPNVMMGQNHVFRPMHVNGRDGLRQVNSNAPRPAQESGSEAASVSRPGSANNNVAAGLNTAVTSHGVPGVDAVSTDAEEKEASKDERERVSNSKANRSKCLSKSSNFEKVMIKLEERFPKHSR